jgi:hypothetical protein
MKKAKERSTQIERVHQQWKLTGAATAKKMLTPRGASSGGREIIRTDFRSVSPYFDLTEKEWKSQAWWTWPSFWKDGNPVDIETFIEKYLGMNPSPGQREVLRSLVGTDPCDWTTEYQQYNLAIGQGGGKNTFIIAPCTAYIAYKIANMKDPWLYFSRFLKEPLDHGTKFEMPNSSMVTERQARNVHFSKMRQVIRRCMIPEAGRRTTKNWFQTYAGLDIRESFGDMQAKTITIPTQSGCGPIVLHSFDSTPTAPEGLHIVWAIVDEASRADTEARFLDMDRLWKVYIGNLNTRFPRGVGKVINFSYLSNSEFDFTWKLHQEAEEEKKTEGKSVIYSIVRSTFEMNPNTSKDDPSIQKAYRTDPIDARARYEGIKGDPREGFYQPHPEKVRECFFDIPNPVEYEFGITERTVEHPSSGVKEVNRFVRVNLTAICGDCRVRGWAFDPGVSGDAFILKGGYIEMMDVMKEDLFVHGCDKPQLIVMNKRPVVDIVIVWQPQKGMSIDYLNVGDVLGELLKKFPNSRFAYTDRYNSEKLRQEVLARGVKCETLHFSNAQQMQFYFKLRWMFWNNIPQIGLDNKHSITKSGLTKTVGEWNLHEHQRLLIINGNKVDHPSGPASSKDMADVDAMLCYYLADLEAKASFEVGGFASMAERQKRKLAECLITEMHNLRHHGVPREKVLAEVAKRMSLTLSEAGVLEEYAFDLYPMYRI